MQQDCTLETATRQALSRYRALPGAESRVSLYPIDESGPQPVDLWSLHMLSWAAGEVFRLRPNHLLDVGSSTLYAGILSQFCLVTAIDIRPWGAQLDGLAVYRGNVLALPYDDGAVRFASCLSVVEHVGLGRYGDVLDPLGSIKACAELVRVLAPGGHLLLALPISHTPGVAFSAHRLHTHAQVLAMLPGCAVRDQVALYPDFDNFDRVATLAEWSYALGCFHMVKEE